MITSKQHWGLQCSSMDLLRQRVQIHGRRGQLLIEPSSCDVIPLDGAISRVPTAFNCIATAIGKS